MEKIEQVANSGLTFSEDEKFFFVNEKNECIVYTNSHGVKAPKFINDKNRNNCISILLAYYSFEIGNVSHLDKDIDITKSFIYLEFNGDREVYDSMLNPQKYKDYIKWKTSDDFDDDILVKNLSNSVTNVEANFTGVILKVKKLDDDDVLYIFPFKIRSYELYTELVLPWNIVKKNTDGSNGQVTVFLSRFQKELIFDRELNCEFILTKTDYEPVIIDPKKRFVLLDTITNHLNMLGALNDENKIMVLTFKGGDREIIRTFGGTNTNKFYEYQDLSSFENKEYYEKLKECSQVEKGGEKKTTFLILSYVPGTEEIMHIIVAPKKESDFKKL